MSASPDEEVYRARAYLLRVAEPPAAALSALVAALGPVEAAEVVRAGAAPGPVPDETTARRHLTLVVPALAEFVHADARLVVSEDESPGWPLLSLGRAA